MSLRTLHVSILSGAALAGALISPVMAQPAPASPPAETPRFTMQQVAGGLMKLDTTTGAMSFCSTKAGAWVCEAVPEDRAALEAEIARLQKRVAELGGAGKGGATGGVPDIMAPPQDGPGPSAKAPLPPATTPDESADLSENARKRVDQAMDVVEQVFRRFMGLVDRLQREQGSAQTL